MSRTKARPHQLPAGFQGHRALVFEMKCATKRHFVLPNIFALLEEGTCDTPHRPPTVPSTVLPIVTPRSTPWVHRRSLHHPPRSPHGHPHCSLHSHHSPSSPPRSPPPPAAAAPAWAAEPGHPWPLRSSRCVTALPWPHAGSQDGASSMASCGEGLVRGMAGEGPSCQQPVCHPDARGSVSPPGGPGPAPQPQGGSTAPLDSPHCRLAGGRAPC